MRLGSAGVRGRDERLWDTQGVWMAAGHLCRDSGGVADGEATDLDGVTFFGLGGGIPVTPVGLEPWQESRVGGCDGA